MADQLVAKAEALPRPVVVIPLERTDAVEAIKDQIYLRLPGRRGSAERTGAADSAFLRCIERHAREHNVDYAVVSSDPDIEKALREWKFSRTLYKSRHAAERKLFAYTRAPERAVVQLLERLAELLATDDPSDVVTGVASESIDLEHLFGETKAEAARQTDVDILNVGPVVGLCDVEISRRRGWIRSCAFLRADLRVTVWYDVDVDGDIQLVSDWIDVHDAVLQVCLLSDVQEDDVCSIEVEDPATVELPRQAYTHEADVRDDMCDAFGFLYGLEGRIIYDALNETGEWKGQFLGREIRILEYEPFSNDDDEIPEDLQTVVQIHLEERHVSVHWQKGAGGRFELYADFDTAVSGFPSWSLSAWLLEAALNDD